MSDQQYPHPYDESYPRFDQYGQPVQQYQQQPQQYDAYQQYDQYGQPLQQQPVQHQHQQPQQPVQQQFPHDASYQEQQQYTQTWEGQTWDTQYQPTIQPQPVQQPVQAQPVQAQPVQAQPVQAQPVQAHAVQQPVQQEYAQAYAQPAADTAYLPPQTGSVPLPPEASAYEPPAAEPAPGEGPAYSPPTTVGNTRITDAQRARAEGRSPIIAPGMRPAALTAVLGLLLAAASGLGQYALTVPLVLLQAVTAAGWFRLNGMWPARQGIALAFLGGLVADAALLAVGDEHAPAAILGTLGVWVLLTLVLQLRSHADPDERMYGLMATVAAAALAILAAGYLAAIPHAVAVGAAAVAVAVPARALPLPGPVSAVVALLAAAGAGIVVGQLTDVGASGALLGLAAGVCALIGLRVASYDYPSRFVHMTAGVALPLTAAVPALYLIGRVIG
ncbi:hypothetical protein A8W25_16360 [Streptomyces sp. ERV7]|uniref:hypothetical protein n=1 Tax=Streptomyces sp. ERV7 TaxID=1322334 RepID=UPI0007F46549|nr:hypothetical protein [Streptomyces sp. ERV7]OAR24035.1 hypothetical protein A8W25_16360 [Streptomyces sp. ERV7]